MKTNDGINDFMELLYVWISRNETGFIQEQGFNFSSQYKFSLKYSDKIGYELDCTIINEHKNIWETGNITGLTAIVGENGSGKTSLINCLLNPSAQGHTFLLYKLGDNILIKCDSKVPLVTHNMDHWNVMIFPDLGIISEQIRICITNTYGNRRVAFKDSDCYFFSPDTDITSYFQTHNPTLKQILNDPVPDKFTIVQNLVKCNVFSQLAILNYYFYLHTDNNSQKTLLVPNKTLSINFSDKYQSLITKLLRNKESSDFDDTLKASNEFREYERSMPNPVYDAYLALVTELSYITSTWDWPSNDPLENAYWLVKRYTMRDDFDKRVADYYEESLSDIHKLRSLLEGADVYVTNKGKKKPVICTKLSFTNHPQAYIAFCGYISRLMFKEDSFVLRYLSINISQLSSGEQALLNISSWLHIASICEHMRYSHENRRNILLLLDEVDLYMHPEWQRKYLDFLSRELHNQFKGYNIQLIITTHSPLVLSDIPHDNIIYLGKKTSQSGCCYVDEGPVQKETFGSNIFTLLKDSFYLERSVGEFAHSRIGMVVEDLQKLKSNPNIPGLREKCQEYKYLIDIIGEPIIKRKLKALYDELFRDDCDSSYQQKLDELKHMLKNSDLEKRRQYEAMLEQVLSEMKDN